MQMNISKKQLESAIQMYRAKADLQKEMLETHVDYSVKERVLVAAFLESQGFPGSNPVFQKILLDWQQARAATDKSQEDAMRVSLAELESQVQIHEAMLREGSKRIVEGGSLL